MKIIHFRNNPNKTPFAANWNFFMVEDSIIDRIVVNLIAKTILSKEKDIIDQTAYNDDWQTGLGPNSLTSRSNTYNLLNWPETSNLKKIIKDTHDKFLLKLDLPPEKVIYAQCWANVLRKGEQIKAHRHWDTHYSYLGGHISIQEGTKTNYIHPFTDTNYISQNEPGKITLFPNWIKHFTDTYEGDKERVTIAFDLITQTVLDEDIAENWKSHWVPLTN